MPTLIGRCGGSCSGIIDSTAEVGDACGVHSVGESAGRVLTSDGANGSSWSSVAGYSPSPEEEWFEVSAVSIAAAAETQLTWSRTGGAFLLDLAVPTQPVVKRRGVYTMDATALGAIPATTSNGFQLSGNIVQVVTAPLHVNWVYSPNTNLSIQSALSLTGSCLIGDAFLIKIYNGDSAPRNFTCPSVRVTKILEY